VAPDRWRRLAIGVVYRLNVLCQADRRYLRGQERLRPRIHADTIAGEVAAGAKLAGLTVRNHEDHLIVDRACDGV
jgi:hypothetical protein